MKISDERINFLSGNIVKTLIKEGSIKTADLTPVVGDIKKAFTMFVQSEEKIEQKVAEKIASLKRGVSPGSQEWNILYNKYYEEEIAKLR